MFLPGKMGKHQRLSIHVQYAEMYQKFILKTDFVKNAENHQMIRLYTKRSFCLISDKKERYTDAETTANNRANQSRRSRACKRPVRRNTTYKNIIEDELKNG